MAARLEVAITPWVFGTGGRADEFAAQGEIAEALGFHSFWLPENHFGDDRSIPSPLMLLAAIAARTRTLRLGSTSYLLPIRHPLQAAEEVAVLDQLSNGRVILGVGRGVQDAMFRAFDVATRDKRRKFKANLDLMIKAWQGEPVAWLDNGEPVILAPRPVQQPHPPIWVAAFGPLALKQAGSLGLPYLASPVETLDKLINNYHQYEVSLLDAGHGKADTIPVMRTVFISDNKNAVREVKATLAQGTAHPMRERTVDIDDWTIVGDAIYVRDKVAEYVDALGMTHLIARGRIPGVDTATQRACLEQLANIAAKGV